MSKIWDRKLAGVALAGVIIVTVCSWRLAVNQPQSYDDQLAEAHIEIPAPDFEALDAYNQMFRLQRYLNRHRILVVFYSTEATAAHDPLLLAVREAYPKLEQAGIKVVGVSTALPQQNRAAMETVGEFPFPLVSDVDLSIHVKWGRIDPESKQPLSGVFLIDRKGTMLSFNGIPQPVADVPALLREMTAP
ncbi:redoxin domain-containing protein [bacterium]|nr:redoxin domain-containing protein [bacterium]